MNRCYFILCLITLLTIMPSRANARDVNFSNFYLFQKTNEWLLRAEFPKIIREVVIEKYELDDLQIRDEEFRECMVEYLEEKVKIFVDDNELTYATDYDAWSDDGDGYVFNLKLIGPVLGKQLMVVNTCLLDVNPAQQNVFVTNFWGEEKRSILYWNKPGINLPFN